MPQIIHKGKGNWFNRWVFIALLLVFLISSLFFLILSPGTTTAKFDRIINPIGRVITILSSPLGKITQEDLLDHGGSYAVVVKNLKTNEEYSLNKDQGFHSASLYKLWVLAVAESQIQGGNLKLTDKLSAKKKDLDKTLELIPNEEAASPAPGDSNPTSPSPKPEDTAVISMTVEDALNEMIRVSDNYAALLLVRKIGVKNIDAFIKQEGYSESGFGSPPTTSAKNIASYMEKLYKGGFVGSEEMIKLLKKQQINDRIPKYLPSQIEVAHKTGELDGAKHDAGIVFSDKGDYIIVVMSQTDNESIAAGHEALFSRDVWNYFQKKK